MQIIYDEGIYLPDIKLWLDPHGTKPGATGFVSHAHADHANWHGLTLCTGPTLRFMKKRSALPPGQTKTPQVLKRVKHNGAYLTMLPAGHIAGSAQLLVEYGKERLMYSGDFKMRPGAASESLVVEEAETLITETTFGKPEYLFPPPSKTYERIARFAKGCLDQGQVPALLAYSLGKAQELLMALEPYDFSFLVHPAVADICDVYRDLGYVLPPTPRPGERKADGCVLIWPPHQRHHKFYEGLGARVRSALVSGWALDQSARYRFKVDEAFPISDHADFSELISYVWQVSPEKIYTHHGFSADFASHLRRQGKDASALGVEEQLDLI